MEKVISSRCVSLVFVIGQFFALELTAGEPLVVRGDRNWRYANPASSSSGWVDVDFDDGLWQPGRAVLGYGERDVATELRLGPELQGRPVAVLFRRRFAVRGVNRFRRLRGRIRSDDGAVVYVNGREVFRRNMPTGSVGFTTFAVAAIGPDAAEEARYHSFAIAPDALREGENVVAISVHQANSTSSDLALDCELVGLETAAEVSELEDELKSQGDSLSNTGPARLQLGPFVNGDKP